MGYEYEKLEISVKLIDVRTVNLPSKFSLVNKFIVIFTFFFTKKIVCVSLIKFNKKMPILNCKEIYFLSTDNKHQYNNY